MRQIICKEYTKNQYGFTLIEVIVTIAIIGIITVPIALIFQGALSTSVQTREKLIATQLSQQAVEDIKTMNMELLNAPLFAQDDEVKLTDSIIPSLNIPDEYTVYFKAIKDKLDDDTHAIDTSIENSSIPTNIDVTINGDSMDIETNDGQEDFFILDENLDTYLEVTRQSSIEYGVAVIKYQARLNHQSSSFVHEFDEENYDGLISLKINNPVQTKFIIDNASGKELSLYVYETQDDTNKPEIILNTGNNSIYRNISEPTLFSHRIYAFEIRVEKGDQVLSKVVTTRLAKD